MHRRYPRSKQAAVVAFGLVALAACGSPAGESSPTITSFATQPVPSSATESPTSTTTTANGQTVGQSTETAPLLQGNLTVEVINEIPHDSTAYTQGLEFHNGQLLESRGLRGQSGRAWIDSSTGEVQQSVSLADEELFGEGITLVDGRFIQLTWKAGIAITGDATNLEVLDDPLVYSGEGWGLCFDGQYVVRSDGTDTLTFHNPTTFAIERELAVRTVEGRAIENINELECVGSQVLANIWGSEQLLAIDTTTGLVAAVIDAQSLRPSDIPLDLDHALNGIAYDAESDTYYLTGKLWPTIFHVRFTSAE